MSRGSPRSWTQASRGHRRTLWSPADRRFDDHYQGAGHHAALPKRTQRLSDISPIPGAHHLIQRSSGIGASSLGTRLDRSVTDRSTVWTAMLAASASATVLLCSHVWAAGLAECLPADEAIWHPPTPRPLVDARLGSGGRAGSARRPANRRSPRHGRFAEPSRCHFGRKPEMGRGWEARSQRGRRMRVAKAAEIKPRVVKARAAGSGTAATGVMVPLRVNGVGVPAGL